MTDKQIRDRIVGALSVSMMPMEMEAECVAFLDRCLGKDKNVLTNADSIRALSDEHLANYLMQFTDLDCRIGFCQNKPKCEALLDTENGIPCPCARNVYWNGSGSL